MVWVCPEDIDFAKSDRDLRFDSSSLNRCAYWLGCTAIDSWDHGVRV